MNLINHQTDICEFERKNLKWMLKFRLPHVFQKIGIAFLVLILLSFIYLKFADFESASIKDILRKLIIVALLFISLAKDKFEDELVIVLRAQSYTLSSIIGVCYALIAPAIIYGITSLISAEEVTFADLSIFEVLWIFLTMQLFFFYALKKSR